MTSPTPRQVGQVRSTTKKPWLGADLAAAVAHGAGPRAGPGLGAVAAAGLALGGGVDPELDLLAGEGVLEADLEIVAQVRAAQRVGAAVGLLAVHELAEDILENVGEGAEILAPRRRPAPPLRKAAWPKRS